MKFERDYSPDGEERWLAWGVGFTGDPRQARFKCDKHVFEGDMLVTTLWVQVEPGKFKTYPLYLFGSAAWHMQKRLECRVALVEIRMARATPSEHSRTGTALSVSEVEDIQEISRAAYNPARLPFIEFLKEFEELIRTRQVPIN